MDIKVLWSKTKSLHDDLSLRLGNETWDNDSYYFALAGQGRESQTDARRVFAEMLELAGSRVAEMRVGESMYLPIGLSDQCSVWLQIERKADNIAVCVCSGETEGWKVDLRNSPLRKSPPLNPCRSAKLRGTLHEFLDSLAAIRRDTLQEEPAD